MPSRGNTKPDLNFHQLLGDEYVIVNIVRDLINSLNQRKCRIQLNVFNSFKIFPTSENSAFFYLQFLSSFAWSLTFSGHVRNVYSNKSRHSPNSSCHLPSDTFAILAVFYISGWDISSSHNYWIFCHFWSPAKTDELPRLLMPRYLPIPVKLMSVVLILANVFLIWPNLVMQNYPGNLSQSETQGYFEWMIRIITI